MSDIAYIMETQDPHELWLVEGENKFRVSRDMYLLLVSNGADLPPTHHINELLTENAKMRKLIRKAWKWSKNGCHECPMETNCKVQLAYDGDCGMALEIEGDMRELGIEVGA